MILAQNHQQRLSGNKFWIAALLSLSIASCTTKQKVLRSSDYKTEEPTVLVDPHAGNTDNKHTTEKVHVNNNIALVLPFQLNRIAGRAFSEEDVKRSALALDYYQGFEIGMQEVSAKGGIPFKLKVLDSEDDQARNTRLAASTDVNEAAIILGPVYPKEIRAFSSGLKNKQILQVSPLAASKASEFGIANLVSLTPSIQTHMEALAKEVAKQYKSGDVVIIYETEDNDSKQFLADFKSEVLGFKKDIKIISINNLVELSNQMSLVGNNILICGSTNGFQIKSLLTSLDAQMDDYPYHIQLYGHPNWSKMSFEGYSHLEDYKLTVTTSYLVDENSSEARKFHADYKKKFTVEPSDFSYKGYDAGRFFAKLIADHGMDYAPYLVQKNFKGLHNSFHFEYYPEYGYVNKSVGFITYSNGSFKLK